MKNLVFILLLLPFLGYTQDAVIHFDIKNSADKEISILKGNRIDADVLFGPYAIDLPLINGKAVYTSTLSRPAFLTIYYRGDTTQMGSRYFFYLSPGDNLNFSVDALNPETSCVVTGMGSKNNQPAIQQLVSELKLDAFKKDSLPGAVFSSIKKQAELNHEILKKYIAKHQPSKEFIRTYSLYVQYYPSWKYIRFKGNQKFNIWKAYDRNEAPWEAIEDSLNRVNPLNNSEVLQIADHAWFLSTYITRLKERVWSNPALAKMYSTQTPEQTTNIMDLDPENLLQERIIDTHFTDKTAEFLYANLLKESMKEKEDYLPEIYARFKLKYPESQYQPYLESDIQKIIERRKRTLTSSMKLVENPDSYQTLDDVLKLVKGKTILLDMWGTWCGPCRSELLENSDSIKHHFKNKGLDYLYIANHDQGKDAKWKELIAYYNMTGTHILANKNLTKDIMTKVKGTGYPTYVIIKKDGTFELSEAGYPMDREKLYKQLDKILKE